jgi:hypothetical protein
MPGPSHGATRRARLVPFDEADSLIDEGAVVGDLRA